MNHCLSCKERNLQQIAIEYPGILFLCHNNCINDLLSDVLRNEVKGAVHC